MGLESDRSCAASVGRAGGRPGVVWLDFAVDLQSVLAEGGRPVPPSWPQHLPARLVGVGARPGGPWRWPQPGRPSDGAGGARAERQFLEAVFHRRLDGSPVDPSCAMLPSNLERGADPPLPDAPEKSPFQSVGEEQTQNPYTELLVLRAHRDIVRFLVQLDDYRFASAGDDGTVIVWNAQTGEKLLELSGHTQKITAVSTFPCLASCAEQRPLLLTASADRTVVVWDSDTGRLVERLSYFQSTVKCLMVLPRLGVWLSGGDELCVWSRKLDLLCKAAQLSDAGITALAEIPKNCVVAAAGKELIIFRLVVPSEGSQEWGITEAKRLHGHQDNILSLVSVNDASFVSGSHIGELIVWSALDWTMQASEWNFWDPSPQQDTQQEIKLCQKPNDISIHHFTCDEENVFAAVGRGLYVYNLPTKRLTACHKAAHDSSVLHIAKLPNRQLLSCSEDGSVRIWELRERQQLTADPVPTGFFNMWGFGRVNKQASQPVKKQQEVTTSCSLELIGDLIGHSSSVEMFLYFEDHGLVTCSADHLIILWKNGERESELRSLKLFQKLEEDGDLSHTAL